MAPVVTLPSLHLGALPSCRVCVARTRCLGRFKSKLPCQRRSARWTYASATVLASSQEGQEVSTEEQGQISSELMQQMKQSISNNLEADRVEVTDVYGDGRHVNIEVVSKVFEGQTSVKRQRLVYKVFTLPIPHATRAISLHLSRMCHAGNLARTSKHSSCCRLHENKHTRRGCVTAKSGRALN